MTDAAAVLDAEYRAFIRSLHSDTIRTILATEVWSNSCFLIAAMGGYDPDVADGRESEAAAIAAEQEWRSTVHPQLLTLVQGHPDPDVRDAADFLVKRLFSLVMIVGRARSEQREQVKNDEDVVAVHLVHDGFMRLRRAAYLAPFRIARPSPRYNGLSIGNTEPLPGKMLETIRALQAAGTLPEGHPILGNGIPEAVEKLTDILWMPEDERRALFEGYNVKDPSSEAVQVAPKFGFAFEEE